MRPLPTLPLRACTTGRWEPLLGAAAAVLVVSVLVAAFHLPPLGWLAGLGYTAVGGAVLTVALRRTGAPLGPAGRVTLTRAALIAGVTALVAAAFLGDVPTAALVALAALALTLDAVDGYVARRTRTASSFGARFDMETDAYLVLALSVHVGTLLGPWVLAIGAMRYAFGAAALVAPWLGAPLPDRYTRKVVAATQGVVLVTVSTEILPAPAATAATALALAALLWSFGRDILLLRRVRRSSPPAARRRSRAAS